MRLPAHAALIAILSVTFTVVAAAEGRRPEAVPGSDANYWQAMGLGLSGPVYALSTHHNQIVAGGAGGVFIWDGSQWTWLGLSPEVLALKEWNGALYAGGTFAGGISRWDGVSWQPLGSGVSGGHNGTVVAALAVYDNQLIAAGKFASAGGTPVSCIASWNGSEWAPLELGVGGATDDNDAVEALAVYDNRLIAAGRFTTAGSVAANYIAAWDGLAWSQVGTGLEWRQYALTVLGDSLIVGGPARVSVWNGAGWSSMGDFYEFAPPMENNPFGFVRAVAAFDGTVIAGGYFMGAGDAACSRIAASAGGTNWNAMWTGMNAEVRALTTFGQRLIAGGYFTTTGGTPASYVACWNPHGEVPVFVTMFDARAADQGVDLSWDIAADEAVLGYKIYRSLEGAPSGEEIITAGLLAPNMRSYRDETALGGRRYEYTLSVVLGDGSEVQSQPVSVTTKAYALALEQNHPNPFNPSTTISFTLPERAKVKLAVYDVQGKLVRTLVDATLGEGRQERTWDGKDTRGNPAATGAYFYRLETADRKLTRKMLLLK